MKLLRLEINAFKKIHPDAPVVIEFPTKITKVKGDFGAGKTGFEEAVLVGLAALSKENPDFINKDSGKLDIGLQFEGNDRKKYFVKVTKSRFELKYEGENLPEPMAKVKELIGVPGVSPMELKTAPLKDVVKWLASYTTKGAEDFEKRMAKLKDGIKWAKNSRADANRAAKGAKQYLVSSGYIDNGDINEKKWTDAEKKYSKCPDINELSKRLTAAGTKSDKFVENETKVNGQKERKQQIEKQISLLQKELEQVNENIGIGEKWLSANANAKKEYDLVKKQYDTAAQDVADYNKWQEIKAKKKEMDKYEDAAIEADAKEKELLEEVKELQAEIIPDVKGVELVLEDEMEDGKVIRKEGLYRGGMNIGQMSETEWFATCMEIWRKNKVKIVVIDNLQSLGTLAIDNLEKLAKDGCYIFAAEMERGTKELIIEHPNSIS